MMKPQKNRDERKKELLGSIAAVPLVWNQVHGHPFPALTPVGLSLVQMIEEILETEFPSKHSASLRSH